MIELTPRELDVLYMMVEGHTKAKIGEILRISESTVKTHMYHIFDKLSAKNAPHCVWQAIRLGVMEPPVRVGARIPEQPVPQFASQA